MLQRGVLLPASAVAVLTGLQLGREWPPSPAWQTEVAAVVCLLSPAFPAAARRFEAATAALMGVGLTALLVFATARTGLAPTLAALQFALLFVLHALAARLAGPALSPAAAGSLVALALAALASAPVWLAPALQAQPEALDLALALSPWAHLAVAAGNDLLRNPWLYGHTPLGGLPLNYPAGTSLAAGYALATALAAWRVWRSRPLSPTPVPLETSA